MKLISEFKIDFRMFAKIFKVNAYRVALKRNLLSLWVRAENPACSVGFQQARYEWSTISGLSINYNKYLPTLQGSNIHSHVGLAEH